jgi:tRNA A-37 threonylcarbamoyl transferase component Bud32
MPQPIDLTAGGVRWWVHPGWADGGVPGGVDFLFGSGGLRLPEWLGAGRAAVVKHGPHRTVYHVVLRGLDFYLKHYPLADRRAWLRQLVRPSKARLEYDRALAVAARGVPTVFPLAVGETCAGAGPRSSYLMTRTLADTQPLGLFLEAVLPAWPPARQARVRQRLAVALGRFLARMHEAGVTQPDLHPGNLLLHLGPEDTPSLYLIDLHAVRLGDRLPWRAARANLVILNRWFMLRAGRADRLRCWHAYEQSLGRAGGPDHLTPRDLERRTLASNLRFWRHHDGRCLGSNRYFHRLRSGSVAGHAVADLDPGALAPLLADPDAPFRAPGVTVLKDSPTSSVVELDLPEAGGPHRVVYKRFAVTRWTNPWAALVRLTPALHSYVLGHGLRLRCLPTPRPLAVWHRRRRGLLREGYLVTEKVPDALDLMAFVASLDGLPPRERCAALRRLIDQVARLVGTLHHRHLSHRDLKAANLLVSTEQWFVSARGTKEGCPAPGPGVAGGPQVWFIDLVGVRRHRKLRRGRRLQNLARLHASFHCHPALTRTDKLRFLRVYLRWGLRGRFGWKRWWRQVERATDSKVRRNLRAGRPLG